MKLDETVVKFKISKSFNMFHSFSLFPSKDYLTDAEVVRDLLFITLGGITLGLMYHVESSSTRSNEDREILDMGFRFTTKAHAFLDNHPDVNDMLAAINSGLLSLMMLYPLYRTCLLYTSDAADD